MEAIKISDLTFSYPAANEAAIKGIDLVIEPGEFVCVCGRTGSGKTTLMRLLKPILAPHGEKSGSITVFGQDIAEMSDREGVMRIGYVMQNPDNQIVTDKVWHELAFGLENIGMDAEQIRVRVAEMATFFGIHNWFDRETDQLSGGQKQMLNLAAVMVMQPDVLLLDEPTASLDPVAAVDFLSTISRISRELGTTIIISEHRLDEVVPLASRLVVLDDGKKIKDGTPKKIAAELVREQHAMGEAMPEPLIAYMMASEYDKDATAEAPLDVGAGRAWLQTAFARNHDPEKENALPPAPESKQNIVTIKDIFFRYQKDSADILKGLSLDIYKGEIFALFGGNGAGKSTLMKILAGEARPYRGKVKFDAESISMLPQNPQLLFTAEKVNEELEQSNVTKDMADRSDLDDLIQQHPYDLSGGEQQRVALAKVLSADTDIVILDEPTKGLDAGYKEKLRELLCELAGSGKTIIITSHDTSFCARTTTRCAMLFDGRISGQGEARRFFAGNGFYTTPSERMSRGITGGTLFPEEVAAAVAAARKA